MRIFDIPEAQYYCANYTAEPGDAEGSLDSFAASHLSSGMTLRESTTPFSQYRSCALRDAERSLFLAASHYRRALDLLLPSASHWAHVTMYYGSWYAARAILGMFGCSIHTGTGKVVDVCCASPGAQELSVRSIGNSPGREPTSYTGPHRRFWDLFYRAVVSLRLQLASHIAPALMPIAGDPAWQADRRNEVNYDTYAALQSAGTMQATFAASSFPGCLSGPLATQYHVLEALLEAAFAFAAQFGLSTDSLSSLSPVGTRKKKIAKLVYSEKAPRLVSRTDKRLVLR
jgi:hypothetical protein